MLIVSRLSPRPLMTFAVVCTLTATAWAAGPADALLALAPPDAGATLAVENLEEHARAILGSPLVGRVKQLPAYRNWRASPQHADLVKAGRSLRESLGQPDLIALGANLFGDAVVLSLEVPPGAGPEEARGLLLLRVRDRAAVEKVFEAITAHELKKGDLERVEPRSHAGFDYQARLYRGARSPDFSVLFQDGTFAWSNSESMLQRVLERKAGRAKGLGDDSRFRLIRQGLPERVFVSLFVDPRFLLRLADATPDPPDPAGAKVAALIGKYLAAMNYAGAGLEWRSGFVLHIHESIDPARLESWQKRWAARQGQTGPLFRRVPPTAFALTAGLVDAEALADAVRSVVPETNGARLDNMAVVARGLLLGLDPKAEILPRLGPAVLAYLVDPTDAKPGQKPPLVAVVGLGDASPQGPEVDKGRVGPALENGFQTVLALLALDQNGRGIPVRVESVEIGDARVIHLTAPAQILAFAVGRGCLVMGTSVEAVAGYLNGPTDASSSLRQLRAEYFPDAQTFACVDFQVLADLARRRPSLGGKPGDYEQAVAILTLFRGAFFTTAVAPDFTSVHRTLGLIALGDGGK